LKSGKPCKEIERQLRKEHIFSRDWIRPRISPKRAEKERLGRWREIPFSMLGLSQNGDLSEEYSQDT